MVNFGNNQILTSDFLHKLQEILSDYSDNSLLSFVGNNVIVSGTANNPAIVSINGYMRTSMIDVAVPVASGAATYSIYALPTTSTFVGTSIFSSNPAPSGGRFLGYAVGTGAAASSLVFSVESEPRDINADFLSSRSSATQSSPNAVPVSLDDGKLGATWFPQMLSQEAPLGTIKSLFVPSGFVASVANGWHIMAGQSIPAASHGWTGLATITLSDSRQKTYVGANPSTTYAQAATPSDLAAGAPGIGAVFGDSSTQSFSHTHSIPAHTHTVTSGHIHSLQNHIHTVPSHNHTVPVSNLFKRSLSGTLDSKADVTFTSVPTSGFKSGNNTSPLSGPIDNDNTSPQSGTLSTDPGTTSGAALTTNIDVRSPYVGLLSIIRVM